MAAQSWASTPAIRASMLANRSTDTRPQKAPRSALHAQGLRYRRKYRIDLREVKPRPDVVFRRAKMAVFMDGCYWHSCPKHGSRGLRTNAGCWTAKLARNVDPDREHDAALRGAGWTVLRIWEHLPTAEAVRLVQVALAR